jgi:hypothetical protein
LLGREHADVPRLLRNLDPELVTSLTFLRQYRNAADYDMEVSESTLSHQVMAALDLSGAVISRLDALMVKAGEDSEAESPAADQTENEEPGDQ